VRYESNSTDVSEHSAQKAPQCVSHSQVAIPVLKMPAGCGDQQQAEHRGSNSPLPSKFSEHSVCFVLFLVQGSEPRISCIRSKGPIIESYPLNTVFKARDGMS
jgi:hypothetical protein